MKIKNLKFFPKPTKKELKEVVNILFKNSEVIIYLVVFGLIVLKFPTQLLETLKRYLEMS